MRSAGNFHPEWGYLAPTPSFARTLRIALVATAVGATAGAGVVVSLLPHRAAGGSTDGSIAAHALVTSAPAAVAPPPAQSAAAAQPAAAILQQATPAGEIGAAGTKTANAAAAPQDVGAPNAANAVAPARAADVAHVDVAHVDVAHADEPAAAAPNHDDAAPVPEAATSKKKKHRVSGYEAYRRWQASREAKKPRHAQGGFEPLFRLFSSRTGLFSAN